MSADAGELQSGDVRRALWQQLSLDLAGDLQLALEGVAFSQRSIRRLDLVAHPVVGGKRDGDHHGEHAIGGEDEEDDTVLREDIEWINHHYDDRPEERSRQHGQRIESQPQREREPSRDRKCQAGGRVGAEPDD